MLRNILQCAGQAPNINGAVQEILVPTMKGRVGDWSDAQSEGRSSKKWGLLFRREEGTFCSWRLGDTSWGRWATPLPVGPSTAHLGRLCPSLAQ